MTDKPYRPLPIVPESADLDWFRSLSTSSLKAIWDAVGDDDEIYHVHCDEVHRVMNERGYGDYVCI